MCSRPCCWPEVDLVVLNSLDIHAHFEAMCSLNVREIVTLLEEVIPVDSGRAVIHSQEIQRAAAVWPKAPVIQKRSSRRCWPGIKTKFAAARVWSQHHRSFGRFD